MKDVNISPAESAMRLVTSGATIALRLDFVRGLAGCINAALLLSQLVWLQPRRAGLEGWWCATADDLMAQTGLSRHRLASARAKLMALGLVECEARGDRNRLWWRVSVTRVASWLVGLGVEAAAEAGPDGTQAQADDAGKRQTSSPKTRKPVCRKSANYIKGDSRREYPPESPTGDDAPDASRNAQQPVADQAEVPDGLIHLEDMLVAVQGEGSAAVPANDPVMDLARTVGLSNAMVAVAWHAFRRGVLAAPATARRRARGVEGWRAQFRRFVERCGHGLWRIADDGGVRWNSEGLVAQRLADADSSPWRSEIAFDDVVQPTVPHAPAYVEATPEQLEAQRQADRERAGGTPPTPAVRALLASLTRRGAYAS